MRQGQLGDYFAGVGVKRLSAVDAEPKSSNQHEVGTTQDMRRQFLGEVKREYDATYVWLESDQGGLTAEGCATHYDARERNPDRAAEWRLYYSSNPVTEAMREGDTLILAMTKTQALYFIVAPRGSTSERQLLWLFRLDSKELLKDQQFVSRELAEDEKEIGFAARFILDEIGISVEETDAEKLDAIIEPYSEFPKTREFSELARETLPRICALDDPDMALVDWLSHEESLFLRLERRIVARRLDEGFKGVSGSTDVDGFVRFSLSVQNRRKSRMGLSLEHHLEAIFKANNITFVRGAVTENNQRPDFLFPSEQAYRDAPNSGSDCLTMLGAKSSCKERWRQVLVEASKIPAKHLLTLEPGDIKGADRPDGEFAVAIGGAAIGTRDLRE